MAKNAEFFLPLLCAVAALVGTLEETIEIAIEVANSHQTYAKQLVTFISIICTLLPVFCCYGIFVGYSIAGAFAIEEQLRVQS